MFNRRTFLKSGAAVRMTVTLTAIQQAPGTPYNLPKSPYSATGMVVMK
jgi:hypothetical protein